MDFGGGWWILLSVVQSLCVLFVLLPPQPNSLPHRMIRLAASNPNTKDAIFTAITGICAADALFDRVYGSIAFFNGLIALLLRYIYSESIDQVLDPDSKSAQKELIHWKSIKPELVQFVLEPFMDLFKVEIHGVESLPLSKGWVSPGEGMPFLIVCDHALMGVEIPLLISEVYRNTKVSFRPSLDHFQLVDGAWEKLLKGFGAFDGTRENWNLLMRRKQPLMVYPGGFEILAKGSLSSASSPGARGKPGVYAEDNQLRWKNRKGFARLAIKHQYTIIPCAVVSSDEMLTNLHELPSGWIRKDLPVGQKSFGEKSKFEKVYIWFGQPISTDQFSNGTEKDIEELRDLTRSSIREGIMEMKSRQDKDTERVIPGIPREKLSSEDYALKAFSERMAKFTEIQKTKKSKK